jgi:hypothetical protein
LNVLRADVAKARALFTLKNVLRALRGKRFVVEAPAAAAGLSQAGVEMSSSCQSDY